MEISKQEMRAILRLIEAKTIFKTVEEFNTLFELWERISGEIMKDCEDEEDV